MARAQQLWIPGPGETFGDVTMSAARLELAAGRLDRAEAHAQASLRRWADGPVTHRARSGLLLATIHVRAKEPRGTAMASTAIDAVAALPSVRARRLLLPLAQELECHSGEGRELARRARQVAA